MRSNIGDESQFKQYQEHNANFGKVYQKIAEEKADSDSDDDMQAVFPGLQMQQQQQVPQLQ